MSVATDSRASIGTPVYRPLGPTVIRQYGPSVIAQPRRGINPLLPLCCLGIILFLIAATIVLALIPVYLSARGTRMNIEVVPYTVLYRLNNGTLPVGILRADNCAVIQRDQRNFSASNNNIAPGIPTIVNCTVTTNSTLRRRQTQEAEANVISLDGYLQGSERCPAGQCLILEAEAFEEALLTRGTFFLILAGANGTQFLFSITCISVIISPPQSASFLGSGSNFRTTSTESNAAAINDIAILNYALVLEHLEANLYTRFQANFTSQNFIQAGFSQQTYDYFNIIYVHELAHVRTLTAIISQLGGSPVSECTYNFSAVVDVRSYISLARILENTGTMAYDGAANGIADTTLRLIAATVATVEARHAAYLNSIEGLIPFPNIFENATVPAVIIQAIQQFIISCPFTITAPTVPYIGGTTFNHTIPISNNTLVSPYTNAMYINDLKVLNYALIAEHLESTFYNTYVSNFTSSDFINNGFPDVTTYFIMIREIENAHAQFLEMTITQRSGTPVPTCTYNFNVTNVKDFVRLSRIFENTGVQAYDGAINRISDFNLILGAATIATIEGREASYLNELDNYVPFPNVTEPTLTPSQVVSLLAAFQTCPFTVDLPIVISPSSFNLNV